jgi:hypothetical protein
MKDIQYRDGTGCAKDDEVAPATEFLNARRRRMTLKGLRIES